MTQNNLPCCHGTQTAGGSLVPPSPEFQGDQAAKHDEGGESPSKSATEHDQSTPERQRRRRSTSPSVAELFPCGEECEVEVTDDMMVEAGLLPSVVEAKVATDKLPVQTQSRTPTSNGDAAAASSATVDDGESKNAAGDAVNGTTVTEPGEYESKPVGKAQDTTSSSSSSASKPSATTYTKRWIKAVVIAVHPNNT